MVRLFEAQEQPNRMGLHIFRFSISVELSRLIVRFDSRSDRLFRTEIGKLLKCLNFNFIENLHHQEHVSMLECIVYCEL